MLSIFCNPQTYDGVRLWKKELIYSEKPEVVLGYKVHQFGACFSFTTKSYKWEERTIFLPCKVAIVNSFILSNTDNKERGEKL